LCFLLSRPAKKSAVPHIALESNASSEAIEQGYSPASHKRVHEFFILRGWMRMLSSD